METELHKEYCVWREENPYRFRNATINDFIKLMRKTRPLWVHRCLTYEQYRVKT